MPVSSTFGSPEDHALKWSAYTRPTTGLVYMQARYYEPETGRFTQADPMPYGFETFAVGQNNRWTYCANDPVNVSDPTGLNPALIIGGILVAIGVALAIADIAANGPTVWNVGALVVGVVGLALMLGPFILPSLYLGLMWLLANFLFRMCWLTPAVKGAITRIATPMVDFYNWLYGF